MNPIPPLYRYGDSSITQLCGRSPGKQGIYQHSIAPFSARNRQIEWFYKEKRVPFLEWQWEHRVSFMMKDNVYLHRILPKCSWHVEYSKQCRDVIHTIKLVLRFFVGFCERRVHKLTSFVDFDVGKINNFLESFIRDHQPPRPIYNITIVFGLTIWTSNCWQNLEWSYSRTLGVEVLYKWSLCCPHHLFTMSLGIALELCQNCCCHKQHQYSWISASLVVHQSAPHPPLLLCLCSQQLPLLQAPLYLDRHQEARHEYHHHHHHHIVAFSLCFEAWCTLFKETSIQLCIKIIQ